MRMLLIILSCLVHCPSTAQVLSNISCTSSEALTAMRGLHDPEDYAQSVVIDDHESIICALRTAVSADSLKEHLVRIAGFGTRHSYSDTTSATTGIGAARRWAFSKFEQFSEASEGRLVPAYLQFDYLDDQGQCGSANGWRDVFAVLPGRNTNGHKIILLEAHLDSRCEDGCDPVCAAEGAEDNGSGSALVLELARVLSQFTFDHTLVFMLTTAEEHGLLGAAAMARFCVTENIAIKGVLNNDVIGGVHCGNSASPPGCVVPGDVDSLQVRLFSDGSITSGNRGLARMVKLGYQEKLQHEVPVPMTVSIMDREDRIGRGGDHIPFRESGFRSIRFTAANEHGDGNPIEGYTDRQHTSSDILGVDTDGDLAVDSFFVDFNYLQRNAVINGMAATLLALGPEPPTYTVLDEPTGLRVAIDPSPDLVSYRIGVHALDNYTDLDALYRTTESSYVIPGLEAGHGYYVTVAGVDADGITSPFSAEVFKFNDAATPPAETDQLPYGLDCAPIGFAEVGPFALDGITLLPCRPNPFALRTVFAVDVGERVPFVHARIVIHDAMGRDLIDLPVVRRSGTQEIHYTTSLRSGIYGYRLVVDGRSTSARNLVVLE
ncbi:MAG TPA: M28 family peptidase [Flavobacteriales bacterium]|nr:M28 family peptidase [Flavobacteriales bacterium]